MEKETVLKIEGLYKKFCKSLKRGLAYGSIDVARSFLGIAHHQGKLRKAEFWALEDVNMTIAKGDAIGILGVNGSGKSTLLRLISGILPPDRGKIEVNGRIGSLIAVGAGFHPHMSGRENIYLNGTILGMSRKEIESKYRSIVEFADIGDFLEAPVSTYSTGMRVRLGFSIAIHCDPDILLVDEILSVGDLGFRNKSLRKMSEYRKKAKAIVFISHDIEQVRVLCNRVIIMDQGKVVFDGETHQGILMYEELTRDIRLDNVTKANSDARTVVTDGETIAIHNVGIFDENGKEVDAIEMSDELIMQCEFELKKYIESMSFYMSVTKDDTQSKAIVCVSNDNNQEKYTNLKPGKYRININIPQHHLGPGVYNANIGFRNDVTFETYQKYYNNKGFKVLTDGNDLERGVIAVSEKWHLAKID